MPINDLDDDALLYILDYIAREDENGAFIIISVCTRWAALALQTATLWRYITLADSIEDWDARLAISTTLARGKPLIVKAFSPISANKFSALLEHQILHLEVHTLPSVKRRLTEDFLFFCKHLRFHRQDVIRRISWYGDEIFSLPMHISPSSSALHKCMTQNLPDAFTETVKQYPSLLLSHFSASIPFPYSMRGDLLMGFLLKMAHLVSLEISEHLLTWSESGRAQTWTFPLMEQIKYSISGSGRIEPRLRLNIPRLAKLHIRSEYYRITSILPNFMGFAVLDLLSLEMSDLSILPISTAALPIGITHINSVMLTFDDTPVLTQSALLSFSESIPQLFRHVTVHKWNMSIGYSALRYLGSFQIPLSKVYVVARSQFRGYVLPAQPGSGDTMTSGADPLTFCDELWLKPSDLIEKRIVERLPLARKLVVAASGHHTAMKSRFLTRVAHHIQELDIAGGLVIYTDLGSERSVPILTFLSLTRLSASLDIALTLFDISELPALEELIILSHASNSQATEDAKFGVIAQAFIEGRSGTALATLRALGFTWWPAWGTIETLFEAWHRLQISEGKRFTLKLPGRPHPRVLEPLVDILSGVPARRSFPAIPTKRHDMEAEECWLCIRSGFTCPDKDHPIPHHLASSQLFTVTQDTYIGEYETY